MTRFLAAGWKSRVAPHAGSGGSTRPAAPLHTMRHIDEDSVTQAVIARHAAARDARLREVVTSLVQHLHAFAREVRLTEDEWAAGLRFLTEAGQISHGERQEFRLLSDTLGLSTLVVAMNQRKPLACTPATVSGPAGVDGAAPSGPEAAALPCFLRGQVRAADGQPVAGADVAVWFGGDGDTQAPATMRTAADGRFLLRGMAREAGTIPHDGPAGRLLDALGRHAWRPARLRCRVRAAGFRTLDTHLFRQGDRHLDADAAFGVRQALIADWQPHDAGIAPDGRPSALPFHTLDYDFVLDKEPTA